MVFFYIKELAVSVIISSFLTTTAMAQNYHPATDFGARDIRAGASITIPFGGDKKKANNKPRVEFTFQQSRMQHNLKLDFNRYSLQDAPIKTPI